MQEANVKLYENIGDPFPLGTSTPTHELRDQMMSLMVPKSEREWWAYGEIIRLQQMIATIHHITREK